VVVVAVAFKGVAKVAKLRLNKELARKREGIIEEHRMR
jgi:hypothetical protein